MRVDEQLSAAAQQRMSTMFPDLLGAVRWRRRRRATTRLAAVVAAVSLCVWFWPGGFGGTVGSTGNGGGGSPDRQRPAPVEICRIVHDDPDVLARYLAPTVERREWFVDDDGLQDFLRFDRRPDGLVRVHGRVFVASAALDPFPVAP